MSLVSCAGADVIRGAVHMPLRGAWWADLKLDTAKAPTGSVSIEAEGGFTLKGTVTRGGVFLDTAQVRVVGGAGGLTKQVAPAAYENALLRDPLNAIMSTTGEALSPRIDSAILSTLLSTWTHVQQGATVALDRLAFAASQALGQSIGWRVFDDGRVWLGAETWTAQRMPDGSDVIEQFPTEGRFVLGVQTPALLPGVNLDGVGHVAATDHYIEAAGIRTFAWVS